MKGLLVHVGDDEHSGRINREKHSDYEIRLQPYHSDPDLGHLTYGDSVTKTREFALKPGDYLFFNFKFKEEGLGNPWYIVAYFCIAEIKIGDDFLNGLEEKEPYKYNAHISDGDLYEEDKDITKFRMFVGDAAHSSGRLRKPILIDAAFWGATDLRDKNGVPLVSCLNTKRHRNGRPFTPSEINGSFLRKPKLLDDAQTDVVLKMMT